MKRVAAFLRRVIVPSSRGGIILRVLVVVALVAVIAGPIVWNSSVNHARNRASSTIAQATAALDKARLAASDGTWEGDQFAKAQAGLYEANASYDSGSFFNRGSYKQAKSHADDSLAFSTSITKRVEDSFASAEALAAEGSHHQAIDAFFRFYKRYPRTAKAQDALDEAESTLLDGLGDRDSIDKLASIANFETNYPLKNVPSETADKARGVLLKTTRAQYSYLKSMTAWDRRWVHAMNSGSTTSYRLDLVSSDDTRELSAALKLVRALRQPPAMRRLLSLLIAGDRCGERIRAIYAHPYSKTSSTTSGTTTVTSLYSSGQVSSISSLISEIAANLSQENKLLAQL
jgi:tetratricopeptide (TPR) repeat protein